MKTNLYDQDDYQAFVFNESRIKTDDRDIDEVYPEIDELDNPMTNPEGN